MGEREKAKELKAKGGFQEKNIRFNFFLIIRVPPRTSKGSDRKTSPQDPRWSTQEQNLRIPRQKQAHSRLGQK